MNGISEQKLHKLVEGSKTDTSAFRELYRIFFPRIFAYVAYRVGQKQDIEDIVAETFLKATQNITNFTPERTGSFSAWLFQIARNEVNTFFRRNHRNLNQIPIADIPLVTSNEMLPDDELARKELFIKVQNLIGNLSPRRQEIILLKYFAGMKNQEIASVLLLDERTVASHLSRGLQDLYNLLLREEIFTK